MQTINVLKNLIHEETGQGMTEYALLIFFIALALIVTVAEVEGKLEALFNKIVLALPLV
ncbi:MAG: Flp family type IVb pilin [Bacillota bacterium]